MRKIKKSFLVASIFLLGLPFEAWSQAPPAGTGLPLPRFVSIRSEEVNMRTGPGVRYPVDWVYHRKSMPVEVVNEFDTWRKVRDVRGGQGWIHQSMLSSRRTMVVTGQIRTIRKRADVKSPPLARVEPGAMGKLLQCPDGLGWCEVKIGDFKGWFRRVEFWGVYPKETLK